MFKNDSHDHGTRDELVIDGPIMVLDDWVAAKICMLIEPANGGDFMRDIPSTLHFWILTVDGNKNPYTTGEVFTNLHWYTRHYVIKN